jgi:hypothetical protein
MKRRVIGGKLYHHFFIRSLSGSRDLKIQKQSLATAIVIVGLAFFVTVSVGTTIPMNAFAQTASNEMQPDNKGSPREDPGTQEDPECWGEITKDFVELEDGQSGIGDHVSNPIPDNDSPHDTPRLGIGNQPEDTPAQHGEAVGEQVGLSCEDEIRD